MALIKYEAHKSAAKLQEIGCGAKFKPIMKILQLLQKTCSAFLMWQQIGYLYFCIVLHCKVGVGYIVT